ncbi:ABC transporter ATP-binding protein [Extibacter muris]|uniref:ABC transporter ATP-binding protein n=1 Tax=Extibacter muris TaxID=1796622 RepID=UPI001D091B86|nr:ABC transporter ATP-binding protein [Extibacter muris]MCB6200887.1 ABC transporter ATP-binding protein [Extibacter muris]MCQ4662217.1 ABC transporter ATP-binding protein [Extibacter muris]MCQ4691869.1 ABC transporter ATP-binding protein [Extibacter muris]
MANVLEVQNLSKVYKTGEVKVSAIKGIHLAIERGLFYSIIGKSGSGKSTLLHLLSGLDKPTSGKVLIEGVDIHKLKDSELSKLRRQKMGFVFQSYNLLPEFCVEENVKMPLYLNKNNPDNRYIKKIMEMLDIADLRLKYPNQLSGGEQQRVALARALAARPSIIFADEPTGNLDVETSKKVIYLLKALQRELDQTVLLVTHDLEIAEQADKSIRLQDGMIIG